MGAGSLASRRAVEWKCGGMDSPLESPLRPLQLPFKGIQFLISDEYAVPSALFRLACPANSGTRRRPWRNAVLLFPGFDGSWELTLVSIRRSPTYVTGPRDFPFSSSVSLLGILECVPLGFLERGVPHRPASLIDKLHRAPEGPEQIGPRYIIDSVDVSRSWNCRRGDF